MEKENLIWGITDNSCLSFSKKILENTPFVNYTYDQRTTPLLSMENCSSIIVVGMGYKLNINKDKSKPYVASGYLEFDYHKLITEKLQKFVGELALITELEYKIFVDTGPLLERELAKNAGLGFYGKNHSIISKKFGSAFFIGYVMTNLNLPKSQINSNSCGNCTKCIDTCPSKILSTSSKYLDFKKCCSYLTQKKGELTEEEKILLENKLYGCDECLVICPFNINQLHLEDNPLDFHSIINLSNREFKEKFKNSGILWRGNATIKRNATIGMYNTIKIRR